MANGDCRFCGRRGRGVLDEWKHQCQFPSLWSNRHGCEHYGSMAAVTRLVPEKEIKNNNKELFFYKQRR